MSEIKINYISKLLEKVSSATGTNGPNLFAFATVFLVGLGLTLLLIRGAFPTPFSDEFYFYRIYFDAKNGNVDLNEILKPHFGHVYVLLKLWLWLVVHYDIDWRISMYLQAAFVGLAIAFISKYSLSRSSQILSLPVVLSIALALGSARQAENLYWAIQISAATMLLATIAAFYFVAKHSETQRNKHAGLALIFSLIALLSNGGGLVTFLITTTAIIAISRKICIKIVGMIYGGLIFAFILSHMFQSIESSAVSSLVSVKNIFNYFLAFFSNSLFSFSERGDDIYSLLTGVIVVILTMYAVISSWRQKYNNLFPYLLICFSVLSCILIAYARLKGGIWQPNASRYYAYSAMILVGNMLILGNSKEKAQRYVALVLFGLISISFAQSYIMEWRISPYRYIYLEDSHFSLCSGIDKNLAFYGDLRYTDTTILKRVFCTDKDLRLAEVKSQPVLKEIGPVQTNRETPFNKQPDGGSALWVRTENCEKSCLLVFSEREIPVVANQDGTLLTASIPKELYESPGEKTVYIRNSLTGKKSQTLIFQVH